MSLGLPVDRGERTPQISPHLRPDGAPHNQIVGTELTVPGAQLPQHPIRMLGEIGVDLDGGVLTIGAGDLDGCDGHPPLIGLSGLVLAAFAEHDQVGHDLGARDAGERTRGQADRADQVSRLRHLLARPRVARIQGVARGQHRDVTPPARSAPATSG